MATQHVSLRTSQIFFIFLVFLVSFFCRRECKELAIPLLNYDELIDLLFVGNDYITRIVHCAIKIGQDADYEGHGSFVSASKIFEEVLKCFQIVPQYYLHNFRL